MNIKATRHPVIIAAMWMTGVLLSFMAMAISGRELSSEIGTFEILFFRSLIGLLIICPLLYRNGWRQIITDRFSTHTIRNLAHYGGQFGWFYGLGLITLAEVFAIEFTIPVWTAILSVIILGERLSKPRLLAVGFGLIGMLIILRPGMVTMNLASIAVLLGAICYAFSHVYTRKLAQTETPLSILFYMTVIQLPLALIPSLNFWVTPSPAMWPWIFFVGITSVTAHYCLTRALKIADATIVIPIDFLRLPLIVLIGYLFYSEPIDWYIILGASVMLTGNYINIRAESLTTEHK